MLYRGRVIQNLGGRKSRQLGNAGKKYLLIMRLVDINDLRRQCLIKCIFIRTYLPGKLAGASPKWLEVAMGNRQSFTNHSRGYAVSRVT